MIAGVGSLLPLTTKMKKLMLKVHVVSHNLSIIVDSLTNWLIPCLCYLTCWGANNLQGLINQNLIIVIESCVDQDLIELHLTYCNSLSSRSLKALTSFRDTLVSLCLYGCNHIFYRKGGAPLACKEDSEEEEEEESPVSRHMLETHFNFQGFNRLRLLNLGGLPDEMDPEKLLKPLKSLVSLDLSNVQLLGTTFLTQWKDRLASLVLYNVDLSDELITTVLDLSNLRWAMANTWWY